MRRPNHIDAMDDIRTDKPHSHPIDRNIPRVLENSPRLAGSTPKDVAVATSVVMLDTACPAIERTKNSSTDPINAIIPRITKITPRILFILSQ